MVIELTQHERLKSVDDLAMQVLNLALPKEIRDPICHRLASDYFADVGMVGYLRIRYLETSSLEEVARLYWSSRRELGSPRVESILSQLLLNLAASLIFKVLEELAPNADKVSAMLQDRGLAGTALSALYHDAQVYWAHAREMLSLYKMKEDERRASEAKKIVSHVISGGSINVQCDHDAKWHEIIYANMEAVARGIVVGELSRRGNRLVVLQEGVRLNGLPAAPGLGYGKPMERDRFVKRDHDERAVLILPAGAQPAECELIADAAAVVTYGGGMTSHVPVTARGMGKPCVLISSADVQAIARHPLIIVDGSIGCIQLHKEPPSFIR